MKTSTKMYETEDQQEALERYLLETSVLSHEQLAVAKRLQARQEGPLLMVLLQLSFIDLQQFSGLLDWTVRMQVEAC